MAATSIDTAPAPALTGLPAGAGRVSLGGALRSEFTKIRSVRSTYWTLLVMVVVSVGLGALASYSAIQGSNANQPKPGFDATMHSLGGLYLSQLVIAVLGALVITSEHSTGMIRTSLGVLPRRGMFVAAKALVFALVAFVTGLVTSFASFFVGQAILSSQHVNATLGQPNVLRAVIGGALFLTACGLLGFGIGLLVRHTAAAISIVVVLLFVFSVLIGLLPQSWQNDIAKWLPMLAGSQIWTVVVQPNSNPPMFGPWTGFAVLCGYAAIAIAAGMVLFRRRNA
jgi:ABC-2 type transport system permease protein